MNTGVTGIWSNIPSRYCRTGRENDEADNCNWLDCNSHDREFKNCNKEPVEEKKGRDGEFIQF